MSTSRSRQTQRAPSNGVEAVELAATTAPDVVLMDLHLPVMSGVEATRQLVQRDPAARVLVLTMFDDAESIRASLRASAASSGWSPRT